jgi:hypothetical protein
MIKINDIVENTTKNIFGTIRLNGLAISIVSDQVRFVVKRDISDPDTDAVIDVAADVDYGDSNRFLLSILPAETKKPVGEYYYEMIWERADGNRYVLTQGKIFIKEKYSDNDA